MKETLGSALTIHLHDYDGNGDEFFLLLSDSRIPTSLSQKRCFNKLYKAEVERTHIFERLLIKRKNVLYKMKSDT